MDRKKDLFNYEALSFFGSVNASISHELKNVMAIISETAGLLSDLSEMARKGTAVDPDLLTSSTDSIIEEIQRGFDTIRQMNRFAHSVDTPVTSVDLMEILDLVRNLSGYLAFAGKIHLHPHDGDRPIVLTSPFILQAIIYQVVVQAFKTAGPEAKLYVSVHSRDDSTWRILFDGFRINESNLFPDDRFKRMAASIGVSTHWDRSSDCLQMDVPVSIRPAQGNAAAE
jgi:signal transduction histidine kinase